MKKMATAILVVVASVGLLSPVMAQGGDLNPSFNIDRDLLDNILIMVLEIVIAALLLWAVFLWVFRTVTSLIEPTNQTLGLPTGSISSLLALVFSTVFFVSLLISKSYFADRTFMLWLAAVYGGFAATYLVARIFTRHSE